MKEYLRTRLNDDSDRFIGAATFVALKYFLYGERDCFRAVVSRHFQRLIGAPLVQAFSY